MGESSLARKTLKGISWSTLGSGLNAGFQVLFTAVLARLLSPADFGLVAMAGVVLRFGSYFSQMGLGVAVVQKETLTDDDIRGSFASSIVSGLPFLAVAWVAAPWAATFFADAKLTSVVRALSLTFVLTGLSTTSTSLLRRNLDFRSLAITDIVSYVVGYGGVGILLAYLHFGFWSLVVAAIAQRILSFAVSYAFSRHPVGFRFDWRVLKPLLTFGGLVSLISFAEFLGGNLDTLIVGRITDTVHLGIYNRAFTLVQLPMQIFVTSLMSVLLPSFSRLQSDVQQLRSFYLKSILLIGLVLVSTSLGMIPAAREIVLVLLGPKWMSVIPLFQIFALSTPLNLLSAVAGLVCEATGYLRVKLIFQCGYVLFLGALLLTFGRLGLAGFAVAVGIGELSRFVGYLFVMRKAIGVSVGEVLHYLRPVALVACAATGLIFGVSALSRLAVLPTWLALTVEVGTGGLAFVVASMYKKTGVLMLVGADMVNLLSATRFRMIIPFLSRGR